MYLSAGEAAALSGTSQRAERHRRRRQSAGLAFVLEEEEPEEVFVAPAALAPLYSPAVALATRSTLARYETEGEKEAKLAAFAAGFQLESNSDSTAIVGLRALPPNQDGEWRLAWLLTAAKPSPGSLAETMISAVGRLDEGKGSIANVVVKRVHEWLLTVRERIPNSFWNWVSVLALITPTRAVVPLTAAFGGKENISYLATFSLRDISANVRSYIAAADLRSCQTFMTLLLKALSARYPDAVQLYNVGEIGGCVCYARAAAAIGLITLVPTKHIDPENESGWSVFTANDCLRFNRAGGDAVYHDMRFIRRR